MALPPITVLDKLYWLQTSGMSMEKNNAGANNPLTSIVMPSLRFRVTSQSQERSKPIKELAKLDMGLV